MISVIIPYCEDRKYLLRCLNSIKRQTYKAVEILLVSNEEQEKIDCAVKNIKSNGDSLYTRLNDAVKTATGEYIFFCSASSILRDNVLEELYSEINRDNVDLACVPLYIPNENDYMEYPEGMSMFGKLYRKDVLEEIPLDEDSVYCEYEFVAKYLTHCKGIRESVNTSVYETNAELLLKETEMKQLKAEVWKRMFDLIGTDLKLENSEIVRKKNQFGQNRKERCEEKYTEKEVYYLKDSEKQFFLVLSESNWQKAPQDEVKLNTGNSRTQQADVEMLLEQLCGDALVTFVLNKFRNGKLGLGTIVKAFIAWLKYKF